MGFGQLDSALERRGGLLCDEGAWGEIIAAI
jgi:hypothetical protein